jgi:Uri superfamily endonuclease
MDELPSEPGSYLLLLEQERAARIQSGRLGSFDFAPGWYAYAGSACGPGGLRARLERHRRITPAPHWHIDYLRQQSVLRVICYKIGRERLECDWSQRLAVQQGVFIPAPGFGASDCVRGCLAHLIGLPSGLDTTSIAGWLKELLANTPPASAGINCIW